MKKCLLFLLTVALCLPLFAGCHGAESKEPFVMPEKFDEETPIEITFWAKNDTNKTQVDIYKEAIKDFEALYPNVKVKLRLYTDYGRIYNDVITNIQTETTPNVCITYPDHIATYLSGKNTVVPLDSLFTHPEYGLGGSLVKFDSPKKEEIVPQFLEECRLGTQHYALPFMRSTEVCYINKTYLERMGYTLPETLSWDFIFEVSEKAMEKDGDGNFKVNGDKVMIPFIYKSTDNMMIQYTEQMGTGYATPEGKNLLFNESTKDFLLKISKYAGMRAFSTFKISSYPANFLNRGQCLFAIDSTAGATWMGAKAPLSDIPEDQFVDFETAVMPIPQTNPEDPKMISQGPSVCIFNKENPQEVLASWLFVQYLISNKVQIAYSQTEGYIPVTKKAQNSPEYQDYLRRAGEDSDLYYDVKLSAAKILIDNTENTFVTPVFNGSASLRNASGQLIEEVTKAMRRNKTVDSAFIDELYIKMNQLYRLDETQRVENGGKGDLGALPTGSAVFLSVLGGVWLLIFGYLGLSYWQKHRK